MVGNHGGRGRGGMTTTIRLEGGKELQDALKRASADVRAAASDAVLATALELRGDVAKSVLRGAGGGVTYQKTNPKRTHTASAPGDPPATDTGRLASSIEFDQIGELTATVGSKLAYAAHLEYGTISMAARPFFRPAVEKITPKYIARLEKALGKALK